MTYLELEQIRLDKFKNLNEINEKYISLINQKNKIEIELQSLQLHRKALMEFISNLDDKITGAITTALSNLEKNTSPSKAFKNKTEFSMQPTITSEKKVNK